MSHVGFASCPADPDIWMRPAKKADGLPYYKYVLLYVDDTLVISKNSEKILLEDAAVTRRTSGQTDVFVSMFVCPSDARSQSS